LSYTRLEGREWAKHPQHPQGREQTPEKPGVSACGCLSWTPANTRNTLHALIQPRICC